MHSLFWTLLFVLADALIGNTEDTNATRHVTSTSSLDDSNTFVENLLNEGKFDNESLTEVLTTDEMSLSSVGDLSQTTNTITTTEAETTTTSNNATTEPTTSTSTTFQFSDCQPIAVKVMEDIDCPDQFRSAASTEDARAYCATECDRCDYPYVENEQRGREGIKCMSKHEWEKKCNNIAGTYRGVMLGRMTCGKCHPSCLSCDGPLATDCIQCAQKTLNEVVWFDGTCVEQKIVQPPKAKTATKTGGSKIQVITLSLSLLMIN